MTPSSILYYPSIHFKDENWVKRALLYWDSVYRIVPVGGMLVDSDFIRQLRRAGLIRDIRIGHDDEYGIKEKVAERFFELATDPNRPLGFDINDLSSIKEPDTNELVAIYDVKFSRPLGQLLLDANIATYNQDVYHMSRRIGGYYMMMLAEEIAKSRNIPLGTDNMDAWALSPVFQYQGNIGNPSNTDGVEMLSSLIIEDIFPSDLSNISAEYLIDQRTYRKDIRKELRENISRLVDRIKTITCPEQAMEEISDFTNDLEYCKRDFRRSQPFWSVDVCGDALCTAVPTFATIFSGLGASLISGVAGIAISGIQFLKNRLDYKLKKYDTVYSYLLGIDDAAAQKVTEKVRKIL